MKNVEDLKGCLDKSVEILKEKTPQTISEHDFTHVGMMVAASQKEIRKIEMGIKKAANIIVATLSEKEKELLKKFAEEGGQFTEGALFTEFHKELLDNEKIKHLIDDSRGANCDYWWINDIGQAILFKLGVTKPIFS